MYVCLFRFRNALYTCYVNKLDVGQIKLIQIHPEPRPTPENLEDCGWNSGWPNIIIVRTLYKTAHDATRL